MQISTISGTTANAALPVSVADALADLGGISPERLRVSGSAGHASVMDLATAHAQGIRCELVDGQSWWRNRWGSGNRCWR